MATKIVIEIEIDHDLNSVLQRAGEDGEAENVIAGVLQSMTDEFHSGNMPLGPDAVYELEWTAPDDTTTIVGTFKVLEPSPAGIEEWHDDRCGACQKVWDECSCDDDDEEDDTPKEPEHGDYVLHHAGPLGGCTAVSVDGRHKETFSPLGDVSADDLALEWVRADMAAQQFWPNVWRCSDHGNYELLTLSPLDAPENGGQGGTMGDAADAMPPR